MVRKDIFNKWSHYVLEFVMLFLAVIGGFVVENFREDLSERNEEIGYMESLLVDLEKDRIDLEYSSEYGKITLLGSDSLRNELTKWPLEGREKKLYHFWLLQHTGIGFPNHDRTISQLKNAGKYRFIRNKSVADGISDYYKKIQIGNATANGSWHSNISNNSMMYVSKIFDISKILDFQDSAVAHRDKMDEVDYPSNLKLLTYDPNTIAQLRNSLILGRQTDVLTLQISNDLLETNKALDSIIRKAYFE